MTKLDHISRRQALQLGAGAAAAAMIPVPAAHAAKKPLAIVELFTSQGCSSCPPADAYMGELVKRDDIVALSFNVDYWDYIGWRDTLASPAYSRRQRDYALRRGDSNVYTPQMIVNGRNHAVGSQRGPVEKLITEEISVARNSFVPIEVHQQGNEVAVTIADGKKTDATVWIAMVTPRVEVPITRGENTGRKITYYNVVRKLIPAGMWKGSAVRLALPKAELFNSDAKACCAFLQEGGVGPIIGAASLGQIHG